MILLLSILAGLLAGSIRAAVRGRRWAPLILYHFWLIPLAFFPQWLAFYLPITRNGFPDQLAPAVLVGSQTLLLFFVWLNRRQPGFRILGAGLLLNLMVISINHGLMPISPETVLAIAPHAPAGSWQIGQRLGWGKDIVLPVSETNLWPLSDWLLFPDWIPYQVAFSIGDVLIGAGAFRTFWEMSRAPGAGSAREERQTQLAVTNQ